MDKLALITGASSGIGREIAVELANRGYSCILVARSQSALEQLANQLPTKSAIITADLSAPDAIEQIIGRLPRTPDVLVNNAGLGTYGELWLQNPAEIQQLINVNITALTLLTRAVSKLMVEAGHGRILNVASIAAFQPGPLLSVYAASKAYVQSLSLALSNELARTGVTVTSLCPGPTATAFFAANHMERTNLADPSKLMTANEVARYGVEAMFKGKQVAVPGLMHRINSIAVRLVPASLAARISRSRVKPL